MKAITTRIETTGVVEAARRLLLDEPVNIESNTYVRIVILTEDDEMTEEDWLRAAARNPVFADWDDPAEDIYSPNEGVPFDEHR